MEILSDPKLACFGGKPIRTSPFAPWPAFDEEVVNAVTDVLRSGKVNYWTGDEGRKFEKEFAQFVGAAHAVTVANGTVALELALRAIGVGAGDEVVVTSRTFIASASCIIAVGARPVFADVDQDSQNITADSIQVVLSPHTKAIIAVHLAGWPCDMDSILALAHARGIKVVEDCAQAHGATYRGAPVGTLGDVAAFSFCQDKIMTTGGEGGMLITNDDEVWQRAWSYRDHGKSWHKVYQREHPPGFRWLHDSFGTNGRMTEMQAAIGRIFLRRLPAWLATRRCYALKLTSRLKQLHGLHVTSPPDDIDHAYYKYYFFVEASRLRTGWDRDRIMNAVSAEGIPCYSGSCSEIYLEDAFPETMRPAESLPISRTIGESCLMVQVHPTLTDTDIEDTYLAIEKVMRAASQTVERAAAA